MVRILWEDTHALVLDKPAGLLSQGEHTGDENLVDWLRQYLGRPYVGLVHRLDRGTSGVMVVAKRTKSASRLTESLQAGRLERRYLAWLEGRLEGPQEWRHWLARPADSGGANRTRAYRSEKDAPPGAKSSSLTVTPVQSGLWNGVPVTLAEFRLETGRTHQIRAQAAAEGYPVLGDVKYGARAPFARLALHSWRLRFDHPMSRDWLDFEAPLPPELTLSIQPFK